MQITLKRTLQLTNLVELKSALSNVNNVMTLLATRAVARKLADILYMTANDRIKLFQYIENQEPNTNGFDIQINTPIKILVEVKCNSLIHDKKFGVAQINAILDDARKLRLESPRCEKIRKNIQDTNDYIKIVTIVNFSPKPNEYLISQITKYIKAHGEDAFIKQQ